MKYIILLIMATGTCFTLTTLMKFLAAKFHILDRGSERSIHSEATPRIAGPALYFGTFLPIVLLAAIPQSTAFNMDFEIPFGIGATGSLLLGLADDLYTVPAHIKLAAQLVLGTIVFHLGLSIETVYIPFLEPTALGIFSLPFTALFIATCMNAVNLIDGMDGLCASTTFISAAGALLLASDLQLNSLAIISISLAGCCIGFLIHNWPKASIFMGDGGSYFIGFTLAYIAIILWKDGNDALNIVGTSLWLGYPIADLLFSMTRRLLHRRPLFEPDARHVHHRQLNLAHSVKIALLRISFFQILSVIAAASMLRENTTVRISACLCTVAAFIWLTKDNSVVKKILRTLPQN